LFGQKLKFQFVSQEPDIRVLDYLCGKLKKLNIETVLAVGGGSVIDTAKIISLMLSNNIYKCSDLIRLSKEEFLEEKIKVIAVPTTAGTGAEATPFSTIWDFQKGKKFSCLASNFSEREIILDPKLTISLPFLHTVSSGLDALCQNLESMWSLKSNSDVKKIAGEGIILGMENLIKCTNNPENLDFRSGLLVASYLSGISISISETTLCHSISYPLTSKFNVPHGLACSFSLLEVLKYNYSVAPQIIEEIISKIRLNSFNELIHGFDELLTSLDYQKIMKPYFLRQNINTDELALECIDFIRSSNNPGLVNDNIVKRILDKSLNYILN
jgi:alcohol dehydrogenase